jgi:hypothetical protein
MTQQDHLENLAEVFAFLDGLRCTGSCSMFAASKFLVEVFDMKSDEAHKAWSLWAKTFTLYTTPEERAAAALAAERAH